MRRCAPAAKPCVELIPELRRLICARPSRLPVRAERRRAPWRASAPRRGGCRRSGHRSHAWRARASGLPSCARRSARRAAAMRSTASIGGQGSISNFEVPLVRIAIAERVHLGKFLAGVDVHDRERHAAEESLARQPDHHVGIFAERPEQGEILHAREGFAQNINALRFELIEAIQVLSRCQVRSQVRCQVLRHPVTALFLLMPRADALRLFRATKEFVSFFAASLIGRSKNSIFCSRKIFYIRFIFLF